MKFKDIAIALGVENYPDKYDEIFLNLPKKTEFCNTDALEKFEKDYNIFGEYYEFAIAGAKEINFYLNQHQAPVRARCAFLCF